MLKLYFKFKLSQMAFGITVFVAIIIISLLAVGIFILKEKINEKIKNRKNKEEK